MHFLLLLLQIQTNQLQQQQSQMQLAWPVTPITGLAIITQSRRQFHWKTTQTQMKHPPQSISSQSSLGICDSWAVLPLRDSLQTIQSSQAQLCARTVA